MSDNEAEVDVSFLPSSGQGGTGKRAVYEPDGAQRCKQVVCSRTVAIIVVVFFSLLVITVAVIAAFARPGSKLCQELHATPTPPVQQTQDFLASNGQEFPWKDIRLPDSILPISYDLFIHPNLTTFIFEGKVSIELKVHMPIDFIVLHAKKLTISQYSIEEVGKNTKKISIIERLSYKPHEQEYFKLDHDLQPQRRYVLNLSYNSTLNENMMGFYKSSYQTSDGLTRYLAVTQFEPTEARGAFPCFDEPSMKAIFSLTMVREKHHKSLFNMGLVKTEKYPGGLYQDKFDFSVKMSTYLVAFIVCDFEMIQNVTARGTQVSVYAPAEQIQQAEFALSATVTILVYYEMYFGMDYPLPKLDLVAIPDFAAGAMENWGLITYRMRALLYDPAVSTGLDQLRVAVVIAHELAHQWFGNLVTMKWWNDLWLNEGFASFVEYIGADRVNPDWKMMEQFVPDTLTSGLHTDSLSDSHPISVPVKDPAEINEIFDSISYNKGASIIRMLAGFIGQDQLQAGLKDYLSMYKWGNAETKDLWNVLSKNTGMDIAGIMDTWTLQMGYPVVMVACRNCNGQAVAQQTHFTLNPGSIAHDGNSPFGYKWQIPLNFITDVDPNTGSELMWMTKDSYTFKVPPSMKWIKVNVNFTGYYRVHYDQNNWKALATQLNEDHTVFSSTDRSQLIDDSFALSRASLMGATTAFDLCKYLSKETDYVPWKVALISFRSVASLLEGSPAYDNYENFVKALINPVLEKLGMEEIKSYTQRELRALLLYAGVKFNHIPSVNLAKGMFNDWMINGTSVSPEFKSAVYYAGIRYGGEKEWQFLWNEYQNTNVPSEKTHLMKSLAATTNAARLYRYLTMSLEEENIRKQDTTSVVGVISNSAAGRILAWNFVKKNWPEFDERYGEFSMDISRLIKEVTSGFTTQYDHEDVKNFFTIHKVRGAKRAIAQSLESIKMNREWLEVNLKQVSDWLKVNTVDVTSDVDSEKS